MTPVRRRDLAVLAVGLAVASWLLVRASYGELPTLDWWLPAPAGGPRPGRGARRAHAEGPAGRAARAPGPRPAGRVGRLARPVRPVEPMLVARLAVLAQASAYVGAVFAGVWAGVLAHVGPQVGRLQAAGGDTVTAVARASPARPPWSPPRSGSNRSAACPRRRRTTSRPPGCLPRRAWRRRSRASSLHRPAQRCVQRLGREDAEEAVAVEHRHPAGLHLQHRGERALQRRVRRHPRLHPLAGAVHRPRAGGPLGGDPAVQVPGLVEDDGPAGAGPLHRGARVGQAVVGLHHGRMLQIGDVDAGHREPLEPAVGPDEVGHEGVRRAAEQVGGGGELLHAAALAHHGDPVADPHGLLDVVGDEHDRLADGLLQAQELRLQPLADDRVDRGERLVHQQHGRVPAQRPGDAGALALATGELVRVAVAVHGRVQPDQGQQLLDPVADALLVPAQQPGDGAHVGADRLVREEPHVLDDVADPAPQLDRVDAGDVVGTEQDPPGGGLDDPVDHLHRGRLAAAGRPDQHGELAGREGEVQLLDADGAVGVDLADPLEPDLLGPAGRRQRGRCGGECRGSSVHEVAFLLRGARW